MTKILQEQKHTIGDHERQIIEESLSHLLEEKQLQVRKFMSLLISTNYNIKVDAFNQKECVICFDSFNQNDQIIRIPSCSHIFHKHCCV
jgi:hypothetical protein